jgi:hypothetical protein
LPGLPFANIAHLGWAVRDIDTTIKNFEDLGLGPWRRYVLGEADGGHDFLRRDYEGGLDNRAKVALSKWGPIAIELFEPIYFPILEKFLETHGEGIWHFGYSVSRKQFDTTIAELKKKGIEVTGHSEYKNGVRMAFLDPRKTGESYFSCMIAHQKWKTSLIQWAWWLDRVPPKRASFGRLRPPFRLNQPTPLSTLAQIAVIDPSSIDCCARLLIDPVVPKRAAVPDDQHGVAGFDHASAIGACFPGYIRGGNTPWEQT